MLSARFRVFLAVLLSLLCFLGGAGPRSLRAQETASPDASQPAAIQDDAKIVRVMSLLLEDAHYSHRAFDDAVSSRLLDRYLDALDPQHVYFFQSDRAEFDKWRTTLDDLSTKTGDFTPALAIFARFQERMKERADWAAAALQTETFTFTGTDTFTPDRKNLPGPRDRAEAEALWLQQLRYEYLQEKLNKATPDKIKETLSRRYARSARAMAEFGPDDILELYLDTLAHVYDPHSDYYGKASAAGFNILLNQSLVGIGVQMEPDEGYAKVGALIPGGPASKSRKLKIGDRILGVGQGASGEFVDIQDMSLGKVADMIRGPQGTTVRLSIHPADSPDPATRIVVPLIRQEIKLEEQGAKAQIVDLPASASGKPLRVGVVDLPLFYQDPVKNKSATADVARLLAKLKKEHVAGVILDLRSNGGGSLPEAISLTGLFIKRGPVVQVRDQKGAVTVDEDTDPSVAYDGPLIVLTNRLSASASEIVTGALQDYGRALVVGDTSTFGKGTVQSVVGMASVLSHFGLQTQTDPGSIHLTVQKFYRPSGASTQLRGVTPNIILPSLTDALDVGERSLDNPLPWDQIPAAHFARVNRVAPFVARLKARSAARLASDKDFAYLRAQIVRFKKSQQQKTVSLNEPQRLKERQDTAALLAARRKELASRPKPKKRVYAITLKNADAPGLPPPLAATAPPATADSGTDPEADPADAGAAPEGDFTLDETERILTDLIAVDRRPAR